MINVELTNRLLSSTSTTRLHHLIITSSLSISFRCCLWRWFSRCRPSYWSSHTSTSKLAIMLALEQSINISINTIRLLTHAVNYCKNSKYLSMILYLSCQKKSVRNFHHHSNAELHYRIIASIWRDKTWQRKSSKISMSFNAPSMHWSLRKCIFYKTSSWAIVVFQLSSRCSSITLGVSRRV